MIFSAWPDPIASWRWLVVRHSDWTRATSVSSHREEGSARREAARLQAEHDRRFATPEGPARPHQMVLGFYSDEQP